MPPAPSIRARPARVNSHTTAAAAVASSSPATSPAGSDLVSRKWLATVVSAEETSTQVEVGFTRALDAEGLLELVDARHGDGRVDVSVDDEQWPILLAISDNGPQMTSGSTRE